ncbi:ribonuclease J [Aestuariibacter sp. GS-14]|uniref:ribonuclease J n=1 Tax=Aestuariibacter sp. GS-14 TaxID=2590670 RepID=UPI00112807FA|nr:ribonuclease J [Aestuariibacter sp. GS-14]TPV60844.1 ribonuclease J [Aestuariibacter sp. GS-14]
MNFNVYGHNKQWLIVDCGVSFDEPLTAPYLQPDVADNSKHHVVAPDPSFMSERRQDIAAMIITHAHEDHIGAVAALWPRLRCMVITTPFTAAVLQRKLAQAGLVDQVPVEIVQTGSSKTVGPFTIQWLAITHSIPEPQALLIHTPVGTVLHTADWKIDAQPISGNPFDAKPFRELGNQSLLAVVGDSTNATKSGFSISERICAEGLLSTIKACQGRVVVACFGSNIARLISLGRIAQKTGRYFACVGRSLENMVGVARETGYWPDDITVITPAHVGYLPPDEVLVVVTGSQGERRAALNRLATDSLPFFELEKGDTVIFSSIVIPGNEKLVERLVEKLNGKHVNVIQSEHSSLPIHASGHPCAEELKLMYQWTQPEIVIPVHGEPEHLAAHAALAKSVGVRKTYVGRNGDLYLLAPQPGIRRDRVNVGRIPLAQ